MKKSVFLVAIAATALASCSSDDVMQLNSGNEINFSVVADNDSRAATVYCNSNLMRGFNLYAGYNNGGWSTFIEEDYITVSENGKCTQTETRYWPENGELTFFGLVNTPANNFVDMISASNYSTEVVWGQETPVVKDFKPSTDVTQQTDLLYAVAAGCTKQAAPVQMNFRHALSQIEFRAKNLNPQLHVVIDAVRVGQTDAQGTYTLPSESTTPNKVDHNADKTVADDSYVKGTWSDVQGKEDYLVKFNSVAVPYDEGKVQDLTISADGKETYNNSLILIPTMEDGEATTPWNPAAATYDGTYLAVYCTIYNVAGDSYVEGTDVAVLHKGWAVIPVSFKWKQGKKYIYTFNFSKEGNGGYEGGDEIEDKEPSDEPVLTGIELEVTVDDFIRGEEPEQEMDTDNKLTQANFAEKIAQGGSFILAEDIALNSTFTISKETKIDLNGKTITNKVDNASTDVIVVAAGAKLTLNGEGTVEAVTGNDGYAIISEGELIINGGTYKAGVDAEGAANAVVYARGNGKVYVNGGTFPNDANSVYVLNKKDADRATTTIEVTGGTFTNFNPANNAAEGAGTNFVAEGYKSVELEEGVYTVVTEGVFYVKNDEELKTALTADVENIEVTLLANVSYAISAWNANAMGGASTKTITIDANGFNLDFNQTNSDWNNVVVNNDATLTIKNGSISNSGSNNGPWNRYDINFNCNVLLEDVVSSKAIALKAAAKTAKLTNVTINEAGDNYALWITAQGQNVELNKVTINSAGRGVKIDSQYNEDSAVLVTLNVTDSKFTTKKKAAIIVKSAAGANITLSNVDIAGVAADNVNAVWVDEDAAATYDVVTVEGGTKVLEGDLQEAADGVYLVTTAAQMVDFAELVNGGNGLSGKTVKLANDIDLAGIEWAPIGQTGGYSASTYFQGTFDGQGHTIKNLTVTKWEAGTDGGANYASGLFGFIDAAAADIKNVTVDGATVKGSHWCGVIAGYLSGVVENCHVMNAAVECTHANSEACGDKAGAVVGATNGTKGTVKNCTAANSTVKAGRDAGQVVGAAPASQVVDCSATNVTVSATGDCTGANVNNAVIGRVL